MCMAAHASFFLCITGVLQSVHANACNTCWRVRMCSAHNKSCLHPAVHALGILHEDRDGPVAQEAAEEGPVHAHIGRGVCVPAAAKIATMLACPCLHARCIGVTPSWLVALSWMPGMPSSTRTTASWPCSAAKCCMHGAVVSGGTGSKQSAKARALSSQPTHALS